MIVVYFILGGIVLLSLTPLIVGAAISAPKYHGPVSDHFNGRKFINPGNRKAQGLPEVIRWMLNRKRGPWHHDHQKATAKPTKHEEGTSITFINHSSFLIQTAGVNILTDPVFSKRVSPFSFAGPSRMRDPGIHIENLPPIQIVLLSHNHYDHLDKQTILHLKKNFDPLFIVPLGVGRYLNQIGITRWKDLDWWQSLDTHSLRIEAVPAQHFSGRGILDRDATLWCGYVVQSVAGKLYFAGDTGYNEITFKEIGATFQSIDIALIPIGAYQPIWFMSPVHCSPDEAVRIHQDIRSKISIATHFGTFPLGDDGQQEPITDLKLALKKYDVPENNFLVLKEGIARHFASRTETLN